MKGNEDALTPRHHPAPLALPLTAALASLATLGWGAIEPDWLQAWHQLATAADSLHHMAHALHGVGRPRVAVTWRGIARADIGQRSSCPLDFGCLQGVYRLAERNSSASNANLRRPSWR